ncbi:MAG: ABC-F family ATP-binding cassette domain-containing protein [Candidatus Cloacimonetes bacterium]|nr:ABC-F family ATP-binding cassette domain-containing protein [Candidatus Cloacimonadota bacterium]
MISLQDMSLEFGGNYILQDINCSISPNSRIGLVGDNGSGKTTLIRVMIGELQPTAGIVVRPRQCHIAYLSQNPVLDEDVILFDYIRCARPHWLDLYRQIEETSGELGDTLTRDLEEKLAQLTARFNNLGGYEYENEISFVLTSLGLPKTVWFRRIGSFSGGEQTRIVLAGILLRQFDLLILDEPTNHLDIEMIQWLEGYLVKLDRPYLLVSHDRRFLDNTVTSIYALEDTHLSITKGNYRSFSEARAIALMSQERMYERQQRFIARTQDFISKNMAGQKTSQAKSRLKMLNRLEIIKRPKHRHQTDLKIRSARRSGNDVFVLDDVTIGINEQLILAEEVNLRAHYRDRVCIIGRNGCGKTTLLRTLLGDREILDGYLKTGASLIIGYYDQQQVELDEKLTVFDCLLQLVPIAPQGYVLSWLARFGFRGDDTLKRVSVLSGGEKSRLYLCLLIHQNPNLLILDEPTNHLDIAMTETLLSALKDYDGTIIFVSHDRYFISQLATRYWVFCQCLRDSQLYNTITDCEGDLELILQTAFTTPEPEKSKPMDRERRRKLNPWYLQQIQQKLDHHGDELSRLTMDLTLIHQKLSQSETYTNEQQIFLLRSHMLELEKQIEQERLNVRELEDQYLQLSYEDL